MLQLKTVLLTLQCVHQYLSAPFGKPAFDKLLRTVDDRYYLANQGSIGGDDSLISDSGINRMRHRKTFETENSLASDDVNNGNSLLDDIVSSISSDDRSESSALLEAKIVEELNNRHNLLVEKNQEISPAHLQNGDFHEESLTAECGWSEWREAGCQRTYGDSVCHNLRYRIPSSETVGCGTYNVHVLDACTCEDQSEAGHEEEEAAEEEGGDIVDGNCQWGDWVEAGCVEVSQQTCKIAKYRNNLNPDQCKSYTIDLNGECDCGTAMQGGMKGFMGKIDGTDEGQQEEENGSDDEEVTETLVEESHNAEETSVIEEELDDSEAEPIESEGADEEGDVPETTVQFEDEAEDEGVEEIVTEDDEDDQTEAAEDDAEVTIPEDNAASEADDGEATTIESNDEDVEAAEGENRADGETDETTVESVNEEAEATEAQVLEENADGEGEETSAAAADESEPSEGIEEVREGEDTETETETTEDSERLKGAGIEYTTTALDDTNEDEEVSESDLDMDEMFSNEAPVSNEVIEEDETETELTDEEEEETVDGGGSNEAVKTFRSKAEDDGSGEDEEGAEETSGEENGEDYDGDEEESGAGGNDYMDTHDEAAASSLEKEGSAHKNVVLRNKI